VSAFAVTSLAGTLDPGTWTPVVSTADYDNANVSNLLGAAVLRVRTDPTDATTEIQVNVGAEQLIAGSLNRSERRARFLNGVTAFYVKPDSGTGSGQKVIWS
jgi:hypothetical protein